MNWIRRTTCAIFGHNGVVREWEWAHSTPLWIPRESWTCVRCRQEFDTPPRNVPQYAMDRPQINMDKYKELCVGTIRLRAKTLDTLRLISYADSSEQNL
jgi:hypothetical protein